MNRPILLSEAASISEICRKYGVWINQCPGDLSVYYECGRVAAPWVFNNDIMLSFVPQGYRNGDSTECKMMPILNKTVGGGEVYVRFDKQSHLFLTLDFMFGNSLSFHYFMPYIKQLNEYIDGIDTQNALPRFPIKKQRNINTYLRCWVMGDKIMFLCYPNTSIPVYDCETINYFRSESGGIDILQKDNQIIAIDGWIKNTVADIAPDDQWLIITAKE
ncbi:MAG: hypothetical protein LBH00_05720 [Planctomycetaceae bacterium]|jgi:hypothetical protein|nr:hypothetical protein [Planctomycetaceae bacterium]